MQVYMKANTRPGQPDAPWELLPYTQQYAIQNLGNVYDLRFVDDQGNETLRAKTPAPPEQPPLLKAAAAGDPMALFEVWWTPNGPAYGEENKSTVRDVFLAGYTARR